MAKLVVGLKKAGFARQIARDEPQIGIVTQIIDIGVQPGGKFKPARKVLITFELPDDLVLEGEHKGRPLLISKEYSLSLHAKSVLRQEYIAGVEGRPISDTEAETYDLFSTVGKAVQLNIIHKVSTRDPSVKVVHIAGISRLMKGITVPKSVHEHLLLSLDDFDIKVVEKLPEWIRKKINMENVPASSRPSEDF